MHWFADLASAWRYMNSHWDQLLIPLGVLVVALVVGQLLARSIVAWLRHRAKRTASELDDLLAESIRQPLRLWLAMSALELANRSSDLPKKVAEAVSQGLLILWVLSLTLLASTLLIAAAERYGRDRGGQVTTLVRIVIRLVALSIGFLIILTQLGVSVTPLATGLGAVGVAIAVGLKDELANFMQGFYISMSGFVRVGQFIRLDTGVEGYVADITWRSTTLRTLANQLVVVPNAKLAQSVVTNFSMPGPHFAVILPVGVSYDSDPGRAEAVLLEELKMAIGEVPDVLDVEPMVRFAGFGDSSLNFNTIFFVSDYAHQFLASSELRKRIFNRFRKEGIEIPFPIRTVYMRGEAAKPLPGTAAESQDQTGS